MSRRFHWGLLSRCVKRVPAPACNKVPHCFCIDPRLLWCLVGFRDPGTTSPWAEQRHFSLQSSGGQGPQGKPLSMIIIVKASQRKSFQHGVRIVFLHATFRLLDAFIANFYVFWLLPLPPRSSFTWDDASWAWSSKNSHQIKYYLLSGYDYFLVDSFISPGKLLDHPAMKPTCRS